MKSTEKEMHERWTSETGLDCVIHPCVFGESYERITGNRYHLCGYVRVPAGHPLHGVSYSGDVPEALQPALERVMNGPVGKRGVVTVFCASVTANRPEMLLDVHGSLTYSHEGAPGETNVPGEWWYGFDCGHSGDDPRVQNATYVRAECESLARQIKELS